MLKNLEKIKIKVKIQVYGWVCDIFEMEGSWGIVKEALNNFYDKRQLEREKEKCKC